MFMARERRMGLFNPPPFSITRKRPGIEEEGAWGDREYEKVAMGLGGTNHLCEKWHYE